MLQRPRRNRANSVIRDMVAQTYLRPEQLVWPIFLTDGSKIKESIPALPGIHRWSVDLLIPQIKEAMQMGIKAFALFPKVENSLKDPRGTISLDPQFFLYSAITKIRTELPEALIITDVALDPYSSDGHDGIFRNGTIHNDETFPTLAGQALLQAKAGAQMVAPSDMMDGRIGFIRTTLDEYLLHDISICSYSAKYASVFYGPFRSALDSAPKTGDKKSYQMDPRNSREALRELKLDIEEGADIVMVKPAMAYLDVIKLFQQNSTVPVAAYQVSGEYSMIKAAVEKGIFSERAAMIESLTAIKRAGADLIFTYYAFEFAALL